MTRRERYKRRKIRRIATRVRKVLYENVNRIDDYPSFQDYRDLSGYCGYGSVLLWHELKKHGYRPRIMTSDCHWFVVCSGLLVDVTASQFGMHKVCVQDYTHVRRIIKSGERNISWWETKGLGAKNPKNADLGDNERKLRDLGLVA